MPLGYDHKYIYSHIGYNLKLTDMQAAVGVAQLKKLAKFIEIRRRNWQMLYEGLTPLREYLFLPQATPGSAPSWFGFTITVKPEAPFTRGALIHYLERRRIATRLLFAGNLTKQPAYESAKYRVVGELHNTNMVMSQTFWIGIYPGLSKDQINYSIQSIHDFFRGDKFQ